LYQRSVSLTFGNESWLQGEDTGERDHWLPIGEPKKRFKIYSAYFDPRLEVSPSLRQMDFYRSAVFASLQYCHFTYEKETYFAISGYKFESELRYEGIFVALNDCFYRATIAGGFKYTAIVDFDELLFPTSDNETLLEYLQTKDRYDVHSFNFQGVFFYDIYSPDFSKVPPWANNTYLYTQVRNVRTKNPLLHHNRSKYVLKGRNVLEAGNHFVWKAVRDTHEYAVPENEGLLMHYRDGSLGYDFENVVLDNRVRERFGDAIWRRVNAQCALIFPETTMCPLGEHYTRTASVR
uniref:Glycosyltransferase family 92 protein n=1 Tax=Anopheles coluzzii TaxID=1518534 RepID=A0A8W7P4Z3_ANOCL